MSLPSEFKTRYRLIQFLLDEGFTPGSGGGSTTPGGSNTEVQFNDEGSFNGSSNFVWDDGNSRVSIVGDVSASINISASAFYGDGANLSGVTATASPGGSNTYIQFNQNSSMAGDSGLVYDGSGSLATTNLSCSANISASIVHIYREIHFSQSSAHTSNFTITYPDVPCYRVDTSSGVVTASLPALAAGMEGMWLNIKDVGLSASTNNVVVAPNGSNTIDGASSLKIQADAGSVGLQADPDSANWYIIFTAS